MIPIELSPDSVGPIPPSGVEERPPEIREDFETSLAALRPPEPRDHADDAGEKED